MNVRNWYNELDDEDRLFVGRAVRGTLVAPLIIGQIVLLAKAAPELLNAILTVVACVALCVCIGVSYAVIRS